VESPLKAHPLKKWVFVRTVFAALDVYAHVLDVMNVKKSTEIKMSAPFVDIVDEFVPVEDTPGRCVLLKRLKKLPRQLP
jgi:hypothetical protein